MGIKTSKNKKCEENREKIYKREIVKNLISGKFIEAISLIENLEQKDYVFKNGCVVKLMNVSYSRQIKFKTIYFDISTLTNIQCIVINFKFNNTNLLQFVCLRAIVSYYLNQIDNKIVSDISQYVDFMKSVLPNIDINYKDGNGNTLAHIISLYNNHTIAENFITCQDQLRMTNNNNETPYQICTNNGFTNLAKYYCEIDPTLTEETNETEVVDYKDAILCVICLDKHKDTLLEPCMHAIVCHFCSQKISHCPICNKKIKRKTKIFI